MNRNSQLSGTTLFVASLVLIGLSSGCSSAVDSNSGAANLDGLGNKKVFSDISVGQPTPSEEATKTPKSSGTAKSDRNPTKRYVLKTIAVDDGSFYVSIPKGSRFKKGSRSLNFKEFGVLEFTALEQKDKNILFELLYAELPAKVLKDTPANSASQTDTAKSLGIQFVGSLSGKVKNLKRSSGTVQGLPTETFNFDIKKRHSIVRLIQGETNAYFLRSEFKSTEYRDVAMDYISSFRLSTSQSTGAAKQAPSGKSTSKKSSPVNTHKKTPKKLRRLKD